MDNQLDAGSPPAMQFSGQQQPTVFGAAANTKIFVGGLAWETKSDTLYHYFEQFGEIIEAVVITEKQTGRSKGYGFVTFVDAEAARRACTNPNPIIDNRRANCNLASTGRPAHLVPYGNLRSPMPRMGMLQSPRGPYVGNLMYPLPVFYGYQPGLPFSPYRYPAYGPDYLYPQMYGVPGIYNPNAMLYGQHGNPQPTNSSYKPVRSYINPGPQMVQYGRPMVSGVTSGVIPMQSPYCSGFSAPTSGTSKVLVATSPQITHGNKLSRQAE